MNFLPIERNDNDVSVTYIDIRQETVKKTVKTTHVPSYQGSNKTASKTLSTNNNRYYLKESIPQRKVDKRKKLIANRNSYH